MTFDEELNQAFDALTEGLRKEVARHVQGVVADLSAKAYVDRERAAADARAAVTLAAQHSAPTADAVADTRGPDHFSGPVFDRAMTERLRDAVRTLSQARTLTDTLALLMTSAALDASRVAVLLVQAGHLHPWRLEGFPSWPGSDGPSGHWGSVAEAWRTKAAVVSGPSGTVSAPAFAESPEARDGLAVPIVLCGEVVAVLYVDQDASGRPAGPSLQAWADFTELIARYAAVRLESLTAFSAARALAGPRADASSRGPDDVSSDEDAAARRYARLLVSEIRLYHEPAVVAGRRDRDLGARLGEEIARARVLYDQRVATQGPPRADYFREELVRTLANGDASLLEHAP